MARLPQLMDDHVLRATIETFRDTQEHEGLSKKDEHRLALLLQELRARELREAANG